MKYIPKDKGIIYIFYTIFLTFIGIYLWYLIGGSATISTLYHTPLPNIDIRLGKVSAYSGTSSIEFSYNGDNYTITSNDYGKCKRGKQCNEIGDQKYILLNQNAPSKSLILTDVLLMILSGIMIVILPFTGIITYSKSVKRRKIIENLQSIQSYTMATIVGVKVIHGRGRGYYYICKDNETGIIYKSDKIQEENFIIGSSIHVYHSNLYPGIYWVDFNDVSQEKSQNELGELLSILPPL